MKYAMLFLERWGLHAFLLPIFFVTHSYQQYYGLVSASVAVRLCLIILICVAILFIVILPVAKNANKALQLVTLFSFIILFFGVIKDFISFTLHSSFLAKYSVLLPILAVVAFFLSYLIVKKNDFKKNNLFQNILLLLFLIIDVAKPIVFNRSSFLAKNILVQNSLPSTTEQFSVIEKPNVYFLVFDSYPGTSFLNKFMNYDNTTFDQELENLGFYIVKNSRSNYNRTAFSIASTLNFEHLQNIRAHDIISSKNYAEACLTIKEAIVPRFFLRQNYSFFNLSIFDIGTNKAIRRETFLTAPEEDILLYNTLPQRIKNDLLWNLLEGKFASSIARKIFIKSKEESQKEFLQKNNFNNTVLDSLDKIPQGQNSPKFVYAHLYLPHPPFFYDENGRKNNLNYVLTEPSLRNKDLFLSYLRYTNKKIIGVVKTIQQASINKSVIIVQSDHGFRDFENGPNHPEAFFTNYSAFYFPDHDYSSLYDTLSSINTFPVILNKYFKTQIPMRPDSSIFLPY